MTTFYGTSGKSFNAKTDRSPMADKVFAARVGVPRLHIRVGTYVVVLGNERDSVFAGDLGEVYEPVVDSPTDRNRRMTMLLVIEHKIPSKHPMFRKVMRAVNDEKDRYTSHRWYIEVEGVRVPIPVSPRVDEVKARQAYLKHERRSRLPAHSRIVFV